MMVATLLFGTCKAAEIFPYPSPKLCLDTILFPRSADNSFDPHGLEFALTCTVNCGTLYRLVLAIPNHDQSIEFITGGLQLSCRNIYK